MKKRIPQQDGQIPQPNPLAISFPEILLIVGYFLAVWIIPVSWLDTAVGAMAFAMASTINPYLSESILGDRPRFSLLQTQGAARSAICASCSAYIACKRGDANKPGMNPAKGDEMVRTTGGGKLGPCACDCGNFPPKIQVFILLTFDHVPEISHPVAPCRAGHGGAG